MPAIHPVPSYVSLCHSDFTLMDVQVRIGHYDSGTNARKIALSHDSGASWSQDYECAPWCLWWAWQFLLTPTLSYGTMLQPIPSSTLMVPVRLPHPRRSTRCCYCVRQKGKEPPMTVQPRTNDVDRKIRFSTPRQGIQPTFQKTEEPRSLLQEL
jgi:hypothetical protein